MKVHVSLYLEYEFHFTGPPQGGCTSENAASIGNLEDHNIK